MTKKILYGNTPRQGKTSTMELFQKYFETDDPQKVLKKIEGRYHYYENHCYEHPFKQRSFNCRDVPEDYMNEQELIILHNTISEHMKNNELTPAQKSIGEQNMAEIRERILEKGIERRGGMKK